MIICEALPSTLLVFPNKFKKFTNTGAGMQDSMTKITFYWQLLHQNIEISPLENATFLWTSTHNITK